jgi:hypothetical protein
MIDPTRPLIGRLQRVELRQAWFAEASDFTPGSPCRRTSPCSGKRSASSWRSSRTRRTSGRSAPTSCRDTIAGHYVLIENQLERTDHMHLGQLLTYAAGLEAVTIIWVASRFTEEHRAALDWLNSATRSGFDFFGLEVELWRIGDSAMAPKFNVVSKPNDWSDSVREQAAAVHSGQFSETQQRHLEFWSSGRSSASTSRTWAALS